MLDEIADFIPHAPIVHQHFLFAFRILCEGRRIVEADVYHPRLAVKRRAGFVSMSANGDHPIQLGVFEFVDVFRSLAGDVDAGLFHYLHRQLVHAVRRNTRRAGIDLVAFEMSGPTFSHLASAGVARAEKKNFGSAHDL